MAFLCFESEDLANMFLYAMLINSVNVEEGEPSERQMTTGAHTVRDIYCVKCGTTLGWKYVRQFRILLFARHAADPRISATVFVS